MGKLGRFGEHCQSHHAHCTFLKALWGLAWLLFLNAHFCRLFEFLLVALFRLIFAVTILFSRFVLWLCDICRFLSSLFRLLLALWVGNFFLDRLDFLTFFQNPVGISGLVLNYFLCLRDLLARMLNPLTTLSNSLHELLRFTVFDRSDKIKELLLQLARLFNRDKELLLLQEFFFDAQVHPILAEPFHEVDAEAQLCHADDCVRYEVLLDFRKLVDALDNNFWLTCLFRQ